MFGLKTSSNLTRGELLERLLAGWFEVAVSASTYQRTFHCLVCGFTRTVNEDFPAISLEGPIINNMLGQLAHECREPVVGNLMDELEQSESYRGALQTKQ